MVSRINWKSAVLASAVAGLFVAGSHTALAADDSHAGQMKCEGVKRRKSRLVPKAKLSPRLAPVLSELGYLRCLPQRDDADGFFAARLERKR